MPYFLELFGDATGNPDKPYALPSGRDSLITSILSAGTFVGALLAYPVGDFLGRRYGIMAFLVLFTIGVACQTGGTTLPTFVVGRVFAGLGVGGTSCLVPMYQSECAPKAIRGAIVGAYQWMITVRPTLSSHGSRDAARGADELSPPRRRSVSSSLPSSSTRPRLATTSARTPSPSASSASLFQAVEPTRRA